MVRAGRQPDEGLLRVDRRPDLDEPGHQGGGARQAGQVRHQDRLPRRTGATTPRSTSRPATRWATPCARAQFEYHRQAVRNGQPVDRTEWGMTPQTVNAYYDPTEERDRLPGRHPAAAVLRHEGRRRGQLRRDRRGDRPRDQPRLRRPGQPVRRRRQAAQLVDGRRPQGVRSHHERLDAQYSAYEPLPGVHVKGKLTMGENIADLSGLQIAYKAWKISLNGKPAPVIDGLTGEQRFYFGFAQAWREKMRDEAMLQPGHQPIRTRRAQFRADGAPSTATASTRRSAPSRATGCGRPPPIASASGDMGRPRARGGRPLRSRPAVNAGSPIDAPELRRAARRGRRHAGLRRLRYDADDPVDSTAPPSRPPSCRRTAPDGTARSTRPRADGHAAAATQLGSGVDRSGIGPVRAPAGRPVPATNGTWVKNTEIPADKSRLGRVQRTARRTDHEVRGADRGAGGHASGGRQQRAEGQRLLPLLHRRGRDRQGRPGAGHGLAQGRRQRSRTRGMLRRA